MTAGGFAAAAIAALLTGMAKCGVPGLGMLSVPLMAMALPARASVGGMLPILLAGDVLAIAMYRQHARWDWIGRLAPWVALGLAGGAWWLSHLSDSELRPLLGILVLAMVALDLARRRLDWHRLAHHPAAAAVVGTAAGIATTLGNAAGPVMNVYLLARGLPRHLFVGTAAWFFFFVNLTKLPVFIGQRMLTPELARLTALTMPLVALGGFVGRWLLARLPEHVFQRLVLALSALAGLRLLI